MTLYKIRKEINLFAPYFDHKYNLKLNQFSINNYKMEFLKHFKNMIATNFDFLFWEMLVWLFVIFVCICEV